MNEYDSGKIADIAKAAAGYEVTDDINEADLVVFNTCSIREKAQEKVFFRPRTSQRTEKDKAES